MQGWLESVVGPDYAAALLWTIVALIVLLVLLIAIRIARAFSVGTFVAGGRNRKTRLAVMDATAVDSHRRLVLVRRDDVEHLILIGGPTDVVVEQNIRMASPTRRQSLDEGHVGHGAAHGYGYGHADAVAEAPAAPSHPRPHAPAHERPAAAPQPRAPAEPVRRSAPAPVATPAPARPEPRFSQHAPAAPVMQPARPAATPQPAAAHRYTPATPPRQKAELDDTLAQELEISLGEEVQPTRAAQPAPRPAPSPASSPAPRPAATADAALDEEMSKLLRDLAGKH